MKKLFFTLLTAGSLLFANSATDAQATQPIQNDASSQVTTDLSIEQVAASKATAKSGTFKMKYNSNVRADAGTKYKVVTMAKKAQSQRLLTKRKSANRLGTK
ncbi:hypothetical protein [Planococcus faecalis]|uniref:hypothetical protein n=1 Tax=Planococcus faecalis TaxID=1598147 RepID=UPI000ACF2B8D|nr:hypothetical protein [Planococcus faecalis]